MYAHRIFERDTVPVMESPEERLRYAREQMGFATATEALERFGWTKSTYFGHENGSRGLTRHAAKRYAKAYKVSIDWLLTGVGAVRSPRLSTIIEDVEAMPPDLQAQAETMVHGLRVAFERLRE